MTNDDKDLKPCPFCGDTKYLRVTYQDSKANASITGDKKYWGVFCMEKCGASIDSIYPTREEAIRVWNTRATPQQPSDPMKELDFKPNGYDMDGNPIQYGFSGGSQQPSENKALSLDSIKTILTKIMKKELVDIGEHFCFVCGEPMSEEKRGLLIDYIAQAIESALPAQREVNFKDLVTELELLKSYFEDTWEVVLHKNDIKWKVIDQAIDEFKKLNS